MKRGNKQDKRCENCYENDEQSIQIQKQIIKQKADNDALVRQLKQLGEDSKRMIETLVVVKPQQPQARPEMQEEVNRKQLEIAKKQLETIDKRIKVLEKKEEDMTFEEVFELVKSTNAELEATKQKNHELKKIQREQDRVIQSDKFVVTRNDARREVEILSNRLTAEQNNLQKKQENKEKLLKKMDEIEARHKEVCQKFGVQPLPRPDFSIPLPEPVQASPVKGEQSRGGDQQKSAEGISYRKKIQSVDQPKPVFNEKAAPQLVLQAKENVIRVNKSIASFEKSHNIAMGELQLKEDTLTAQKQELEKELEMLNQECAKAQAMLKELQGIPKDQVLESSSIKPLMTEIPNQSMLEVLEQSPVDSKTLMQNKNKFKRELQGAKLITEHASLWADYNVLQGERNYKMSGVKFYTKDLDILRVEIEYQLESGDIQLSIQPENSDDVVNDKDIKLTDIRLSRNEHFSEVSGLQDSSRITLLRIRTSHYNDYQVGAARFSIKQREFKFSILPTEKPISIFGCFDLSKTHEKKVLAQLGLELARKEIVGEQKKSMANKSTISTNQLNNNSSVINNNSSINNNNNNLGSIHDNNSQHFDSHPIKA